MTTRSWAVLAVLLLTLSSLPDVHAASRAACRQACTRPGGLVEFFCGISPRRPARHCRRQIIHTCQRLGLLLCS